MKLNKIFTNSTSNLIIVLSLVIVMLSVFLIMQINRSKESFALLSRMENSMEGCQDKFNRFEENLIRIMWNQWQLEKKEIKDIEVMDEHGEKVDLKKLILSKKGKVLVLNFFSNSCEDCQIQEMRMIQNTLDEYRVIVVALFQQSRNLFNYVKSQGINLPTYQILDSKIVLNDIGDDFNNVFAFVTDSTLKSSFVHIGKGDLPEFSEKYYELISKKFGLMKGN